MTHHEPHVSASITLTLVRALQQLGVNNTDALLDQAGINKEVLAQPENRLPFSQQESFWQLALDASNETLPLVFARQSQPASFSITGYIAMNSNTIGEALDATAHYLAIAGEGGRLEVQRDEQSIHVEYIAVNAGDPISSVRSCAVLAANLMLGRWLIGDAFNPTTIELMLPAPADESPFQHFFSAPLGFSANRNRLSFERHVEAIKIPHASLDLLNLMKTRADGVIEQIKESSVDKETTDQVTRLLISTLMGQEPDKARIAEQLGMSQRTLQRRLSSEGSSYQQVLDNTRHQLALDYLKQPELTISDIAYLLGFTEPSAFYRAFKKWHGQTPGQLRDADKAAANR